MSIIQKASIYAGIKHQYQKYDDYPYTYHLNKVFEILKRFDTDDEELLAAAWLHDSVEDTDATVDEIRLLFGDSIADLVWRVTDEPGKNRKERHANTYPKIKASDRAVKLKLADRIANVEKSIESSDKLLGMYRKEFDGFKSALYTPGLHEEMWTYLENLFTTGQIPMV